MDFSVEKQDTNILKGIAICAMLFHHLYAVHPLNINYNCSESLCWLGELGKVCVAAFLFCSGYGLATQYGKRETNVKLTLGFIAKRLIKFYTNYWAVFVIFVPISVFVFNRPLTVPYGENVNLFKRLAFDVLGIQGFHSYNVTWWFNLLILIFYLLFPLVYWLSKKSDVVVFMVSLILLRLKSIIPGNFIDIYVWQFPFVLGILWKRGENNWPRMSNWLFGHKIWFSVFSILLVLTMICLRMFPILPFWSGMHVDGFLSCSLVLLVISSIRYWHYLALVLSKLGKHSMNIYLIHAFIVWYWYPYWLYSHGWLRNGGGFIVLIAVCLSISILLEWMKKKCGVYWLSGKMIEKII